MRDLGLVLLTINGALAAVAIGLHITKAPWHLVIILCWLSALFGMVSIMVQP